MSRAGFRIHYCLLYSLSEPFFPYIAGEFLAEKVEPCHQCMTQTEWTKNIRPS